MRKLLISPVAICIFVSILSLPVFAGNTCYISIGTKSDDFCVSKKGIEATFLFLDVGSSGSGEYCSQPEKNSGQQSLYVFQDFFR
jgi:hypothetical protein